ncbi:unnamed protein product [Effrenium voratum]|nr:unnamed protein product [Effrenium voratum]
MSAAPAAGPGDVWRIVHLHAQSQCGATLLDPVHAELRFLSKWRPHLPLQFDGSRYPTIAALGPLPAACTHTVVGRKELLPALALLDPEVYGAPLSPDDESCRCLLDRIGLLTSSLLYEDPGVWETYTCPTLMRSAPRGFGWATAFAERRRQLQQLREEQFFHEPLSSVAVLVELRSVLEALSDHLGDGSFDAGAEQLVVLLSIPCDPGSSLQRLLTDFPAVSRYVGCIEERLPGTWPDYSSFMLALSPDERPPPPPMSAGTKTVQHPGQARREWWEVWGWSWGGRNQPVAFGGPGKSPAAFYAIGFGIVTGLSFLAAILCGLGSSQPLKILRSFLASLSVESEQDDVEE